MTSQYDTSSWRDDFDLEPNTHPTIAYALQGMRAAYIADLANKKAAGAWPFPSEMIPVDRKTPPPRHPDAEDAPI